MLFSSSKSKIPSRDEALPDRDETMPVPPQHVVNGHPLQPPFPAGLETAIFGLGCFWGAERLFWQLPGVYTTAVGYAGGHTKNPTYEEVCSGRTGHAEVVLVVFDPTLIPYAELLRVFWEGHDPTQGMRQGNDVGTQYRSAIYCTTSEQRRLAEASKADYERALARAASNRLQRKFRRRRPSIMRSLTISSISRRTPAATAGWAERVLPVQRASPRPRNGKPRRL